MKLENILFWILILTVIGIAVWLAFGSPGFETSFISIIIFAATSVILLWRTLFAIENKNLVRFSRLDKRTSVGFERVKSDFKLVNNKLESINKELVEIKNSLKFKKK